MMDDNGLPSCNADDESCCSSSNERRRSRTILNFDEAKHLCVAPCTLKNETNENVMRPASMPMSCIDRKASFDDADYEEQPKMKTRPTSQDQHQHFFKKCALSSVLEEEDENINSKTKSVDAVQSIYPSLLSSEDSLRSLSLDSATTSTNRYQVTKPLSYTDNNKNIEAQDCASYNSSPSKIGSGMVQGVPIVAKRRKKNHLPSSPN